MGHETTAEYAKRKISQIYVNIQRMTAAYYSPAICCIERTAIEAALGAAYERLQILRAISED